MIVVNADQIENSMSRNLLPMILVRNQIRNVLGGETGKITGKE